LTHNNKKEKDKRERRKEEEEKEEKQKKGKKPKFKVNFYNFCSLMIQTFRYNQLISFKKLY